MDGEDRGRVLAIVSNSVNREEEGGVEGLSDLRPTKMGEVSLTRVVPGVAGTVRGVTCEKVRRERRRGLCR